MKFFPSSLTKNAFTWFSNIRPNSITTWAQLENAFHAQFYRGELNVVVTDLVALKREDGETINDFMIRFKNARSQCYVSLPESEVVKIAIMGLEFYMRQKWLNVHIPDLAHLAEREEFDWEAEVDLAEFKKGPPYLCSLLKKIPNSEKSNDVKQKSGKRYSFDILKLDQIFDVLLKDKQLVLPEGRTLLLVKDLKGKPYCKFHQATSHLTNNCVRFRDFIQEAIMEGRLKFDDGKKEMKFDSDPFDSGANFSEPYFGVNMVRMYYDFDVALGSFESDVRSVYPGAGDGLLDFLVQQKLKDRDVSLCP
ncbi:hypothetical protein Ahy_B04g073069 isoform A [Arachis hypogaea]|uniref:Retrotransposon gag domain-containing protein n=1 Tax=Arachis hypogaea TaxID=3818 RepID=A0A444ZPJ9_ARAHY|nr:hypothetical protein Ahy_B04g073069 isoform A [Arachis hypogaea]